MNMKNHVLHYFWPALYYFIFSFFYHGSWSLTLEIYIIFAQSLPFYIGVKFNVFPDVIINI